MTSAITESPAYILRIKRLGACSEALDWCRDQGYETLDAAWLACERADWMLWLLGCIGVGRRRLVGCAAACARETLPIFKERRPNDDRVRHCLDLCDRFAAGDESVSLDDLRNAAVALLYTTTRPLTAPVPAAAYAAKAAVNAAHAAADANAAEVAANAAAKAGAYAAYAAGDYYAARRDLLKRFADIVREWFPAPPSIGGAS